MTESPLSAVHISDVPARLDRLPLSGVHWRLILPIQFTYGATALTGSTVLSSLYAYVWAGSFGPSAYAWLHGLQTGLGLLLGAVIGGYLSDRFGRKPVILAGAATSALTHVAIVVAGQSYPALTVALVTAAAGLGFVLATATTYMHELVPPRSRGFVTQMAQSTSGFPLVTVTLVGFFVIPARYEWYLFAIAIGSVISILLLLSIPESPRWLSSRDRHAEALRIVERIELNCRHEGGGRPAPFAPVPKASAPSPVDTSGVRTTARDVFSGRYLKRSVLLTLAWVLGYSSVVYGVLAYSGLHLPENGVGPQAFYVFVIVSTALGPLGMAAMSLVNERVERHTLLLIAALLVSGGVILAWLGGVFSIIPALYAGWLVATIGSTTWVFNMVNYTAVSYPTRLRSLAVGWVEGLGHLGALIGPAIFVAAAPLVGGTGWVIYCVVGALAAAALVRAIGGEQRGASLEESSH